ncbi:MAG: hypothetical protein ACK5QX_02540 [bacterium]|jgi:hypothetical protein
MLLRREYLSEGVDWQEEINVTMPPVLAANIENAQRLLESHDFIFSVVIKDHGLEVAEIETMHEECRIGFSAISVYPDSWYWKIESKYDSAISAEYSPAYEQ